MVEFHLTLPSADIRQIPARFQAMIASLTASGNGKSPSASKGRSKQAVD
jgi:hypothetical protein